MKRILIHIIARYYLWKFRAKEQRKNAKWRIHIANTGSLYIQIKVNGRGYKSKLRISDHAPYNRHGNPRTKNSKKRGIVI